MGAGTKIKSVGTLDIKGVGGLMAGCSDPVLGQWSLGSEDPEGTGQGLPIVLGPGSQGHLPPSLHEFSLPETNCFLFYF